MPIKKINEFPEGNGSLTSDDIFLFMDNPSGGGTTKKIILSQIANAIGETIPSKLGSGQGSVIGGGYNNTASGIYSTVGGGSANTAGAPFGTVGGGTGNTASSYASTVAGGWTNTASEYYSTVGGGYHNDATGPNSTVSGGRENTATALSATVGGGFNNTASGAYSAIIGGFRAVANRHGMEAYAAGRFAANGDAQRVDYVLRNVTTNATPTTLMLDGSTSRLLIANGRALFATITIAGIINGGSKAVHYCRKVAIKTVSNTTSLIGTVSVVGTDVEDDAAYDVTITADNGTKALQINVTGKASENIRWVAHVEGVEIGHG